MHAHKMTVTVPESRELTLTLPSDVPTGEVEIIVLSPLAREVARPRRHTLQELFDARLTPPAGVGPVTLADIEKAIAEGATGRGGV